MNPLPITNSNSSIGPTSTTVLPTSSLKSTPPKGKPNANIDLSKLVGLITQLIITRLNINHNINKMINSHDNDTPETKKPSKSQSTLPSPSIAIIRSTPLPHNDNKNDLKDNPFLYKSLCRVLLNDNDPEKNQGFNNQERPPEVRYQGKTHITLRTIGNASGFQGQDGIGFNPIRRTFTSSVSPHDITVVEEVDLWQVADPTTKDKQAN